MPIQFKSMLFAFALALCTAQPMAAMDPGYAYPGLPARQATPGAKNKISLEKQLMDEIDEGDIQKTKNLIDQGANVNYLTFDGSTPLMRAAKSRLRKYIGDERYVAIAQILLEKGAQINQTMEFGNTALMYAAGANNVPLCKLLLNQGAILEKQQTKGLGYSAFHFAADDGHTDAITTLLTTIPLSEKIKIRKTIHRLYQIKHAQPQLPRDVRRLITQDIINELVTDHMNRIEGLLLLQNHKGKTARETALIHNEPEAAQLLDLNNSESRNKIRKQIKNNVRRILLGEPQVKTEPKKPTHFEMIGIESDDSAKEAKEKIATYFLSLKGI